MLKGTRLGIIVAAAVVATPVAALEGNIYDCTFKVPRSKLLSDRVIFVVSPDGAQSRVHDGIVHYVEGNPVKAQVIEDTGKKLKIRWSVMFPFSNGAARVDFRVAYFKGNKKATMSSQAVGYVNQYNARGNCVVSKGNL